LSEEEKKLIGSTAPKKIAEPSEVVPPATNSSQSVWNSAGTWEEKDLTTWATTVMESCVKGGRAEVGSGKGTLRITKVEDLEGSARTPIIRGKKRWLYEWSFKVNWELQMESEDRQFTGYSTVKDVGSVEELELSESKLNTSLAGSAKDVFSSPSKIYKEIESILRGCLREFEGHFHKK
jgi:hypothetical protein